MVLICGLYGLPMLVLYGTLLQNPLSVPYGLPILGPYKIPYGTLICPTLFSGWVTPGGAPMKAEFIVCRCLVFAVFSITSRMSRILTFRHDDGNSKNSRKNGFINKVIQPFS